MPTFFSRKLSIREADDLIAKLQDEIADRDEALTAARARFADSCLAAEAGDPAAAKSKSNDSRAIARLTDELRGKHAALEQARQKRAEALARETGRTNADRTKQAESLALQRADLAQKIHNALVLAAGDIRRLVEIGDELAVLTGRNPGDVFDPLSRRLVFRAVRESFRAGGVDFETARFNVVGPVDADRLTRVVSEGNAVALRSGPISAKTTTGTT